MSDRFAKKYQAQKFDPTDPNERLADRARQAVITAYMATIDADDDVADRQMEYLLSGLLVGGVQVVSAVSDGPADNVDAAIRASIVQTAAWAVDTSRAMEGKDPLPET